MVAQEFPAILGSKLVQNLELHSNGLLRFNGTRECGIQFPEVVRHLFVCLDLFRSHWKKNSNIAWINNFSRTIAKLVEKQLTRLSACVH